MGGPQKDPRAFKGPLAAVSKKPGPPVSLGPGKLGGKFRGKDAEERRVPSKCTPNPFGAETSELEVQGCK